MTPSEFRKDRKKNRDKRNKKAEQEQNRIILKKLDTYLYDNRDMDKTEGNSSLVLAAVDSKNESVLWKRNSNLLINAGTASDLIKSAFQKQILHMKTKLGVKYVRFWDIYDPDFYLDIHSPKKQNYSRLDEAIDFLVKNDLKPYIELGFKPLRLLKTTQDALVEISRDEFKSDQEVTVFFEDLIKHLLNRYGEDEVLSWYFEYWKKEDIVFVDLSYTYTPMNEEYQLDYFKRFDLVAGALRKYLPNVKIGGGGFALQHYKKTGFELILESWMNHKQLPDFISLNCYPYQLNRDGNIYFEKKSTDMFFVKHNLQMAKEVLEAKKFREVELHVSEYGFTLSNRNVINDHCSKGAYLMQNTIDCIDEADLIGHWLSTDLYADFQDTQRSLFGGCGLLTKSGIPKPAFYTFEFMQRMYNKCYSRGKHYFITGNGKGKYRMVCHNFKNLNDNYFMRKDNEIEIEDIPYMLESRDSLTLHTVLRNINNGIYIIKHSQINQECGSVQDEWARLNLGAELNIQEQDYLERISTPRLTIEKIAVDSNYLEFDVILKPNEIRYIQIAVE